jgi:hypothetical protein
MLFARSALASGPQAWFVAKKGLFKVKGGKILAQDRGFVWWRFHPIWPYVVTLSWPFSHPLRLKSQI